MMKRDSTHSKRFSVGPTLPILAAAFFTASLLEGGTVFMKNGYIIQGPVVDNDASEVVLGWDYGKVTIHRRFYENVVLEPEEEAMLARRHAEAEQESEFKVVDEEEVYGKAEYELPADFQDLAKELKLFPGVDPLAPADGSTSPVTPEPPEDTGDGTDAPVRVTEIPKGLGGRVDESRLAFSINPPVEWTREDGEGGRVQWTGTAQEDGFIPSLIIVSTEVEDWDYDKAREAFKKEIRTALPALEVIREGPVWIRNRETFQITGRAVVHREKDGVKKDVEISVRQILVPGADRFWLCTTFTSASTGDEILLVLERALQSLEFSAAESDSTGEASAASSASTADHEEN